MSDINYKPGDIVVINKKAFTGPDGWEEGHEGAIGVVIEVQYGTGFVYILYLSVDMKIKTLNEDRFWEYELDAVS